MTAEQLVESCETSPSAVADALNRGGLRAHRERDYARATRFWELAVRADPARTGARYNLACGYALTGNIAGSLAQLEQLRSAGDEGRQRLLRARADEDLVALRGHPDFERLTASP